MRKFISTTISEFLNEKKGTLLAPNGSESNLNNKLHVYARSEEFKAWFGDWENHPNNSSKIVDENGEPMIYYKSMEGGEPFFGTANGYYYGITVVSPDYEVARGFKTKGGKTYSAFIKSFNPFDFRIPSHRDWLIGKVASDEYARLYTKAMDELGSAGYEYAPEDLEHYIEEGAYAFLEWDVVYNMIREKGYDSFYVMEDIGSGEEPNLAIFDKYQIKAFA
jgi:hypothetical protein